MQSTTLTTLLDFIIMVAAGVIIISLVVFLIKDVISFLKGQGTSIFSILAKIGGVLLIVALIFVSRTFFEKGEVLQDGLDSLTDKVIEDINSGIE